MIDKKILSLIYLFEISRKNKWRKRIHLLSLSPRKFKLQSTHAPLPHTASILSALISFPSILTFLYSAIWRPHARSPSSWGSPWLRSPASLWTPLKLKERTRTIICLKRRRTHMPKFLKTPLKKRNSKLSIQLGLQKKEGQGITGWPLFSALKKQRLLIISILRLMIEMAGSQINLVMSQKWNPSAECPIWGRLTQESSNTTTKSLKWWEPKRYRGNTWALLFKEEESRDWHTLGPTMESRKLAIRKFQASLGHLLEVSLVLQFVVISQKKTSES